MEIYKEYVLPEVLSIRSLYTFSKQNFAKDYHFKGESHDFIEAVCVTAGKVGVTADKDIFILSAGQMILHPAGEFHAIWSDCGTAPETIIFSFRADAFPMPKRRVFALSPDKLSEIKNIFRSVEQTFVLTNNNVENIRSGKELLACAIHKRIELFLLEILDNEISAVTQYKGQSAETYAAIVGVMKEHLCDALSAQEIARRCNISIPTLERTVERYSRCGAMTYYNLLKMQRAEQMLLNGVSVKEVALTLGFSNQNYFSASFKKWSGKAPSFLRKTIE